MSDYQLMSVLMDMGFSAVRCSRAVDILRGQEVDEIDEVADTYDLGPEECPELWESWTDEDVWELGLPGWPADDGDVDYKEYADEIEREEYEDGCNMRFMN